MKEKLIEFLKSENLFTEENSCGTDYFVPLSEYSIERIANEFYKLHLESQLILLHTLKDTYFKEENKECLDDIIHNLCKDLETKLKELE
jgi:hypothetical protein